MIGKIIGAVAGERAAKHFGGINGPGGALIGAGAATVLRRLGPLGLIAAAAGGYALKHYLEKRDGPAPAETPGV
jgi:hypothetical protein